MNTIDAAHQKFIFRNIFLVITKSYSFLDFHYYFETIEHSRSTAQKQFIS